MVLESGYLAKFLADADRDDERDNNDTNHGGYVAGCVTAEQGEPNGESDEALDARFEAGLYGECCRSALTKDPTQGTDFGVWNAPVPVNLWSDNVR